jgi:hypothetical protein
MKMFEQIKSRTVVIDPKHPDFYLAAPSTMGTWLNVSDEVHIG